MNNFELLLNDNTRSDNYVSATCLCKAFGKQLKNWLRNEDTKAFVESVSRSAQIRADQLVIIKKNGSNFDRGTWVHPLVAIHLAEWLSPDFSVFVKQTFKGFIEADPEIAKSVIERQTSKKETAKIESYARSHGQYLRSEFSLNYECDIQASWLAGRVKGHNNDNLGIPDGDRSSEFLATPQKKDVLTAMQLLQSAKLNQYRKEENGDNPNEAKDRCYKVTQQVTEIMGNDYVKPRDWYKMKPESQKRLLG